MSSYGYNAGYSYPGYSAYGQSPVASYNPYGGASGYNAASYNPYGGYSNTTAAYSPYGSGYNASATYNPYGGSYSPYASPAGYGQDAYAPQPPAPEPEPYASPAQHGPEPGNLQDILAEMSKQQPAPQAPAKKSSGGAFSLVKKGVLYALAAFGLYSAGKGFLGKGDSAGSALTPDETLVDKKTGEPVYPLFKEGSQTVTGYAGVRDGNNVFLTKSDVQTTEEHGSEALNFEDFETEAVGSESAADGQKTSSKVNVKSTQASGKSNSTSTKSKTAGKK